MSFTISFLIISIMLGFKRFGVYFVGFVPSSKIILCIKIESIIFFISLSLHPTALLKISRTSVNISSLVSISAALIMIGFIFHHQEIRISDFL